MFQTTKIKLSTLLFLLLSCSACEGQWWHHFTKDGGYWWHRGQPKSVAQLLSESQENFNVAVGSFQKDRQVLTPLAKDLAAKLLVNLKNIQSGSGSSVNPQLAELEKLMMSLEGKLSIGSRPAYGELSSELRAFVEQANKGEALNASAFGLYSARTLFFLANELSVPAPV